MVIHISILLLYRPEDVDGCHRVVCPSYCSNGSWASICHYCQSKPVECPSCCKDGCKLPECALPKCKPKPVEVPKLWCPSCCKDRCNWFSLCAQCHAKPVECPSCCKDGCKLSECALPQCKPKPVEHRGDSTRDWWWRRPRWGCPSCCKWGCFHIFCVLPQCRRVWG